MSEAPKKWENTRKDRVDSCYYSVLRLIGDGMAALRELFPAGEADELNAVLFSTSGVHGHYCTIEDVECGGDDVPSDVTFVVIQPRIVCMRYGNVTPRTPEDFAFLKRLRDTSHKALCEIGRDALTKEG